MIRVHWSGADWIQSIRTGDPVHWLYLPQPLFGETWVWRMFVGPFEIVRYR